MRIQTKFTVVECLVVGTRERHTLHRACRCLLEFSANLEQKMRKCWTKCCICTRSDLLLTRDPVCRRALTIFVCQVHIAVCGCVSYNRKADFDIAVRLFRLGARLLAQYERDCIRMVG